MITEYPNVNLAFDGEYAVIPAAMQESLREYVLNGRPVGDFLTAVLSNDLFGAVGRADAENLPLIPTYVRWVYNRVTIYAHGDYATVERWIAHRGFSGSDFD